jgi:hypothetical protein
MSGVRSGRDIYRNPATIHTFPAAKFNISRTVRAWNIAFSPIPRVSPLVWYILAFQAGGGKKRPISSMRAHLNKTGMHWMAMPP